MILNWIHFEIWSWNTNIKYLSSIIFLFPLMPFSPHNLPKSVCNFSFHSFVLQRTLHLKIFYWYDALFSCQPGFLSLSALFNSFAFLNCLWVYVYENLISLKLPFKQEFLWFLWSMTLYIHGQSEKCLHCFLSHKRILVLE